MPAKAPKSAVSAIALEAAAKPTALRMAGSAMAQAGSPDALARLSEAIGELKALAIQPLLDRAVAALNANDFADGANWAIKALEQDERSGFGWYLLGIARERVGDFSSSVTAYETALRLLPDHAEIANDLGRLAHRLDMKPQAEKLFRHFLARYPGHPEGANNLATTLRDLGRTQEGIDFLRPAIMDHPAMAMLWNTMGTLVADQGDFDNAKVFLSEAVRLDPANAKAIYNLGNALLATGDAQAALVACEKGLSLVAAEDERQMMRLARSTILMALGRLGEGWEDYEARLHPAFHDVTLYQIDRPRWTPGCDVAGKTLLVFGEQGLGDEVLFANTLPDLLAKLGPKGRLLVAVEPRLVSLFQRSFPEATVGPHATYVVQGRTVRLAPFAEPELAQIDLWAPIGLLLEEFRRTVEAFPPTPGFIKADPARVAHWRDALAGAAPGPKVGLLWKSAITANARHRYFSPFAAWAPVLATPGVTFVNLQYGDCAEELAQAERDFGAQIWNPPGIDLKQDLDDVAALCQAMDLVLGFSNATFNLAAAGGAPSWLITAPGAWTLLGTQRYPWYPQARVFIVDQLGAWDGVMGEVAEALQAFVAAPER